MVVSVGVKTVSEAKLNSKRKDLKLSSANHIEKGRN